LSCEPWWYGFINSLKREGLTSILTRESPVLLGGDEEQDNTVAFVVDSYVLLRYVEIESAIHRALLVLKLRGGDTPRISASTRLPSRHRDHEQVRGAGRHYERQPRRMADAFMEAFKQP